MTIESSLGAINIPEELDSAIAQLLGEEHPFDKEGEFDVVEFLNSQFPCPENLEEVHEYSISLREELIRLDDQVRNAARKHADASRSGRENMEIAREGISELRARVVSIRNRAEESEKTVKSVSRDIMLLDTAKRNVELTIVTLKRLVTMVNACEQLATLSQSREYAQTPALITSIRDLETSFLEFIHIPRIDELLKHKNRILKDLGLQILEDFDLRISLTFPTPSPTDASLTAGPRIMASKEDVESIDFAGAAEAADALGDEARREIVNKYCLLVLDDYKKQFAPPAGTLAPLEHYEKRLQWLTRALKDFTDKHNNFFPPAWMVNGELCMHFCHETRQHFIDLLSVPSKPQDSPELMVVVLVKFMELENDMQRRFDKVRSKLVKSQSFNSGSGEFSLEFRGVVSSCFESHLKRWVVFEERQLQDLIAVTKSSGIAADALMGNAVQLEGVSEDDQLSGSRYAANNDSIDTDPPMVYTSTVALFARMRASLQKCRQFNTGQIMVELFAVFRSAVVGYIDTVLRARLPTPKQINATSDDATTQVCAVVGSLDYCLKMAPNLHKSCMSILNNQFAVNVSGEIQKLAEARELAQETLVHCIVGGDVRSALSSIAHLDWWNCESASSVSPYVGRIKGGLDKALRVIANSLSESHYRAAVEQMAFKLISQVMESINSAKPISEVGAQQLLVDVGEIKSTLLEMPNQVCPERRIQQTYSELVNRGFHRLECVLKALSSPACEDRQSLRAMLDSLDPELSLSGPGALDREVDRILSLRKGPTSSSTIHSMAPVTALFGSNLDSHFVDNRSNNVKAADAPNSAANPSSASRPGKPDMKADFSQFGSKLMKGKLFGNSSSSK